MKFFSGHKNIVAFYATPYDPIPLKRSKKKLYIPMKTYSPFVSLVAGSDSELIYRGKGGYWMKHEKCCWPFFFFVIDILLQFYYKAIKWL